MTSQCKHGTPLDTPCVDCGGVRQRKPLHRTARKLWHVVNGRVVEGSHYQMSGDCSGLWGECTRLVGECSGLRGECSGLVGGCSGLVGECSNLRGDCTGLVGDLSEILEAARPCNLRDWVTDE